METEDVQFSRVSLPTRLDNRVLDLRVSDMLFGQKRVYLIIDTNQPSHLPNVLRRL